MSIPSLAILAYGILFFIINKRYFTNLDSVSLALMNINGAPGRMWVVFMCYAIPGLFIALFGVLCLQQSVKDSIGRTAYPLIFISGLSWASLSLNPMHPELGNQSLLLFLIKIFTTLGLGTLGFLLLAIRHKELRLSTSNTIALSVLTAAIVIESGVHVLSETHLSIYSTISYIAYFMIFGVLALQFKSSTSPYKGLTKPIKNNIIYNE